MFELGPCSLWPAGKSGEKTLRWMRGTPWLKEGDKPCSERACAPTERGR